MDRERSTLRGPCPVPPSEDLRAEQKERSNCKSRRRGRSCRLLPSAPQHIQKELTIIIRTEIIIKVKVIVQGEWIKSTITKLF